MNRYSSVTIILFSAVLFGGFAAAPLVEAATPLDVWWPASGATVQGAQPFKALVEGLDVSTYDMYWQVDGGTLNPMQNSSTDYPHKEINVDVTSWNWHGAGPYVLTFVAKQNNAVIGQKSVSINTGAAPAPLLVQVSAPAPTVTTAANSSNTINVWWPTPGTLLQGTQPLKAAIPNLDVQKYSMYWQVDGGPQTLMPTNTADAPHKEANVNVTSWNWQPTGTYTLTFTAKDANGMTIATYSEAVVVNASKAGTAPSTTVSAPAQSASVPSSAVSSASSLYVDPNSQAAKQASSWANSNPTDAAKLKVLANAPTAAWFGGWSGDVRSSVSNVVGAASAAGKTAVLVAYNIPQRDCGGYSAGGASDYVSWINAFAQGIGNRRAIVILEPDALSQMSCLSSSDQAARFSLLAKAVTALKSNSGTSVYLDAGHAGWVDANAMARELTQAGVASADGFSLNVSNFDGTASETTYGTAVSAALGGKHFVIDTSRNGNGSNGQWCNPSGRAIGTIPTTQTGSKLIDAFLWVKTPGESDGNCNGGPSAGSWWVSYALGLVQNAH